MPWPIPARPLQVPGEWFWKNAHLKLTDFGVGQNTSKPRMKPRWSLESLLYKIVAIFTQKVPDRFSLTAILQHRDSYVASCWPFFTAQKTFYRFRFYGPRPLHRQKLPSMPPSWGPPLLQHHRRQSWLWPSITDIFLLDVNGQSLSGIIRLLCRLHPTCCVTTKWVPGPFANAHSSCRCFFDCLPGWLSHHQSNKSKSIPMANIGCSDQ